MKTNINLNFYSWTSKTLTLNTFDTNSVWMGATNSRITITENWLYCINWAVTFASNITWVREVLIRKNWNINTDLIFQTNQTAWAYISCPFSRYMNLIAWDYIEVRAFQTSWWNLDVLSSSQLTYAQVIKI